jgi:transcriptional regulator GlxA family with amidase domain
MASAAAGGRCKPFQPLSVFERSLSGRPMAAAWNARHHVSTRSLQAGQRVVAWLESGVTSPGLLLCVCAGSVIAGKAGLLAGRECTSHHAHIDELRAVAADAGGATDDRARPGD